MSENTPKPPPPPPSPAPALPDVAFEPVRTVQEGWSQPIFIVHSEGRYYLTKVVWPYDEAIATSLGGAKKTSFDLIKSTFDTTVKLEAVLVDPESARGLTNGFTGGR